MTRKNIRLGRLLSVGTLLTFSGAWVLACASGGEGDDTGVGGSGGSAAGGSAGSSGTDGGSTGGTGGTATGGTGGTLSTGGSAGSSTGGSAGSSTGGSAGSSTGGSAGSSTGGSAGSSTGGSAGSSGAAGSSTGGTAGGGTGGSAGASGASGAAGTSGNGEICNGLDDNSNGQIDEGNPGGGGACTVPNKQGVCAAGTYECRNGGIVCIQTSQPSPEVCDGLDNNCNGVKDENNPGGSQNCFTTELGQCKYGTSQCDATQGQLVCVRNNDPVTEVCNGLDDNCDGATDENDPEGGGACDTGKHGDCAAGIFHCTGGQKTCEQQMQPVIEACDGHDNDCDGVIDQSNPGGNVACTVNGAQGVCAPGTTQCQSGVLNCLPNATASSETCDGEDDDCNGSVDDGNPLTLCTRSCPGGPLSNPAQVHIQSINCAGGACAIDCENGYLNANGNPCDGCETTTCTSQPTGGASCGAPQVLAATVSGGASVTGQLTTIPETRYFQVTFQQPTPGQSFHPKITLTQGAADYQMDILSDCSGSVKVCPEPNSRAGVQENGFDALTWEMDFAPTNTQCVSVANCTNQTTLPTILYVKISRITDPTGAGNPNRCNPFQVSVTQ